MHRIGKISLLTLGVLGLVLILSTIASKKVKAAEDEGRIAYQSTVNMTGICSGSACTFKFPTVPAGRRVVIEHISGLVQFSNLPGNVFVRATTATTLAGLTGTVALTQFLSPTATTSDDNGVFDQIVEMYVDAGETLQVGISPQNSVTYQQTGGSNQQVVTLAGYELNCSATPCSAIAN